MTEIHLTIANEAGLHARPAAIFAQTAQKFESKLTVKYAGREANAKSLLSVLALGVSMNSEIVLEADGSDAEAALQAFQNLVNANFEGSNFQLSDSMRGSN